MLEGSLFLVISPLQLHSNSQSREQREAGGASAMAVMGHAIQTDAARGLTLLGAARRCLLDAATALARYPRVAVTRSARDLRVLRVGRPSSCDGARSVPSRGGDEICARSARVAGWAAE